MDLESFLSGACCAFATLIMGAPLALFWVLNRIRREGTLPQ